MSVQQITPYLFFTGKAEAAVHLYESTLGAKVEALMRWGDQPQACPPGQEKKIMHAALHIGEALLLLSDSPGSEEKKDDARGPALAVQVADADDMQMKFNALAQNGTVVDAIHDAFWGDKFGVVRDKFGVTWMFTCPTKSEEEKSQ